MLLLDFFFPCKERKAHIKALNFSIFDHMPIVRQRCSNYQIQCIASAKLKRRTTTHTKNANVSAKLIVPKTKHTHKVFIYKTKQSKAIKKT